MWEGEALKREWGTPARGEGVFSALLIALPIQNFALHSSDHLFAHPSSHLLNNYALSMSMCSSLRSKHRELGAMFKQDRRRNREGGRRRRRGRQGVLISRQSHPLSEGPESLGLPYPPKHIGDHDLSKANAASPRQQVGEENEESSPNKT